MNDKYIELKNFKRGWLKTFRFDEAVALLNYEAAINFKGWILPDDSKYIFSNGKPIQGGGDSVNKGAEEFTRNTESKGKKNKAQTSYGT